MVSLASLSPGCLLCFDRAKQMIFIYFFFFLSLSSFLQSFSVFSLCVFVCVSPLAGGKRENPSLAAWGGAVTVVQTAGQQFERWWWCVFPCSSAVSVSDSFSLKRENRASLLNPPSLGSAVTSTLVGVWWAGVRRGGERLASVFTFFSFFFF